VQRPGKEKKRLLPLFEQGADVLVRTQDECPTPLLRVSRICPQEGGFSMVLSQYSNWPVWSFSTVATIARSARLRRVRRKRGVAENRVAPSLAAADPGACADAETNGKSMGKQFSYSILCTGASN
jgi:hypothetical protein